MLSLEINDIYEILGKTVQEVNQALNDVQVDEMFSEINLAQSNGPNVQVIQNAATQVDESLHEINMAREYGPAEKVNQQVRGLKPDLFWEKKITKSLKGRNQVLVLSYANY